MTRREKRIIDVINDVDRYKASYYFDIEFDKALAFIRFTLDKAFRLM